MQNSRGSPREGFRLRTDRYIELHRDSLIGTTCLKVVAWVTRRYKKQEVIVKSKSCMNVPNVQLNGSVSTRQDLDF